ncbi:hypothetical protein Tcan_17652 [Toxocara canis]|uniref:Uncharacterized protein n=1 Tax=Toxocara canis TaxID=6265 RepID=A0A0B2UPB9_TOXCA|nr:hypothetical protein Tcan_17652 [Toxocara canis]
MARLLHLVDDFSYRVIHVWGKNRRHGLPTPGILAKRGFHPHLRFFLNTATLSEVPTPPHPEFLFFDFHSLRAQAVLFNVSTLFVVCVGNWYRTAKIFERPG